MAGVRVAVDPDLEAGLSPGRAEGRPCPGPHETEAVVRDRLRGAEVVRADLNVEVGVV